MLVFPVLSGDGRHFLSDWAFAKEGESMTKDSRTEFLRKIAALIVQTPTQGVLKVAIDGVDGAGKTFFTDELATQFRDFGVSVIRASVDGFHNPREFRYQRGRSYPEGFYRDSYNYVGLKRFLLDPLSEGGAGNYCTKIFDCSLDQPVRTEEKSAPRDAILLLDGIFLHRPELFGYWDFSMFLDVDFSISIPRGAQRGAGYGSPDPVAESNSRYIEGQKLYFKECQPKALATLVIDNNNLLEPRVSGGTLSKAAWDAVDYGIDLSLIESNLKTSYQERLEAHESARALAAELRRSGEQLFKT